MRGELNKSNKKKRTECCTQKTEIRIFIFHFYSRRTFPSFETMKKRKRRIITIEDFIMNISIK